MNLCHYTGWPGFVANGGPPLLASVDSVQTKDRVQTADTRPLAPFYSDAPLAPFYSERREREREREREKHKTFPQSLETYEKVKKK